MPTLDSRPNQVDLRVYGGDDFVLRLDVTGADYSAADWSGQIRLDHDADVDAEFVIVPDATGATAALSELATAQLAALGVAAYSTTKQASVRKYQGVWDIQVNNGGSVKTLVQGLIEVYADVTRA